MSSRTITALHGVKRPVTLAQGVKFRSRQHFVPSLACPAKIRDTPGKSPNDDNEDPVLQLRDEAPNASTSSEEGSNNQQRKREAPFASGAEATGCGAQSAPPGDAAAQPQPQLRRRGRPRARMLKAGQGEVSQVSEVSEGASGSPVPGPQPPARRGRPPRGPNSPPPPGERVPRDIELRVLLLRALKMHPDELRPPRASWRKLMRGMTAPSLSVRVQRLVEVVGAKAVRSIATKCPHVFLMNHDTVASKLQELNLRLPLSRQELMLAVCRFPGVLQYAGPSVGARAALLVHELNRSEHFVAKMVASQPQLLGLREATLRYRINMLHEAASLLPNKWIPEMEAMPPSTLGRLLRCSDVVLQRLTYTYLRSANNGRQFRGIRAITTICHMAAAKWDRDNPPFADWLQQGEEERRSGAKRPWVGWARVRPGEVDWWEGKVMPGRQETHSNPDPSPDLRTNHGANPEVVGPPATTAATADGGCAGGEHPAGGPDPPGSGDSSQRPGSGLGLGLKLGLGGGEFNFFLYPWVSERRGVGDGGAGALKDGSEGLGGGIVGPWVDETLDGYGNDADGGGSGGTEGGGGSGRDDGNGGNWS